MNLSIGVPYPTLLRLSPKVQGSPLIGGKSYATVTLPRTGEYFCERY
jgi:hypothetical protein